MTNMTTTTNGMAALKTSFNSNVDLFGRIGSARGVDLSGLFAKAMGEDTDVAVRVLQWSRDIRGGAGERQTFRNLTKFLATKGKIDLLIRLVPKIPVIGRWDDLFTILGHGENLDAAICEEVAKALYEKNGLCAKWMPRKGPIAVFFTKAFGLSPRQYRKLIVGLTNVVEQKMCAKQWDSIEFGKIPSIAAKNYQRAFKRNAPVAYQRYVDGLATGESKINAGAIFPYDVIRGLNGVAGVADAQWKALPNYMEGSDERLLAVVDVSSSMNCPASQGLTCMEVAVSLGMYVSERSEGIFRDKFITFDDNPKLMDMSGLSGLHQRVNYVRRAPWGGSTNLEKTFRLILDAAVRHKMPQEKMPTKIVIFSDMQFNQACGRNGGGWPVQGAWENPTAFEMIDKMYSDAGYKRPDIVFWNLNGTAGQSPVSFNEAGTMLVSGFSPALIGKILTCQSPTPKDLMLEAVMVERYNW